MNNRSSLFFPILLLIILESCKGQPSLQQQYSLLTWETYREGSGTVPPYAGNQLAEYTTTDTGYSRKVLFESGVQVIPDFTDYNSQLYDNRYVINTRGDIFDLQENKFIHLHIGDDYFVEKNGDTVVMRHRGYKPSPYLPSDTARHRSIKTPYYFFQLSTHKIIPFNSGSRYRIGQTDADPTDYLTGFGEGELSPDKTRKLFFVPVEPPLSGNFLANDTSLYLCGWTRVFRTWGNLVIINAGKTKQQLGDSVRFEHSFRYQKNLPMLWMNDNEILVQKTTGQLLKIKLQPYQEIVFPAIADVFPCSFPPYFSRTPEGNIVYHCATQKESVFSVDTVNNKLIPLSAEPIGYGYATARYNGKPASVYGTRYTYHDTLLLEDSLATRDHILTKEGLIAIASREIIPTRNQYDPWWWITVYDPELNKKQIIKVGYLKQLIGWRRKN